MAAIRNVIFDWSGTLVDDLAAVWRSTNFTLTKAGKSEMSLDQFRAEFSLPFNEFYSRITPGVPLAQLEEWYKESFVVEQESIEPLPHAREFFDFCATRKLRTFLLSTIHPDHYRAQSTRIPFAFEREYVRVMDKRTKIRELLTENELAPEDTVFIGDMQHDVETAKLGGVGSCAVLTGYNKRNQLEEANPDFIANDLGHLKESLDLSSLKWPPIDSLS